MNYKISNKGLLIFWGSVVLNISSFFIANYWVSFILWLTIFPLIYGSHAAVHNTLVPTNGILSKLRKEQNEFALLVGFALQFMNFKLIRPAHYLHHSQGRYDVIGSPDVTINKPTLIDFFKYYIYLLVFPAIFWQFSSFIFYFIPSLKNKMRFNFELGKSKIPDIIPLVLIISIIILFIYQGGLLKFLVYEIFLILVWNLTQNVTHYGLKGIDEETNRVCAHSYDVEPFFKQLTYGSLSHLAHHVEMTIPGEHLTNPEVIQNIENKIGVQIIIKKGIHNYLFDILKQLKGPLHIEQLNTKWIKN